jgi:hypothetical protein
MAKRYTYMVERPDGRRSPRFSTPQAAERFASTTGGGRIVVAPGSDPSPTAARPRPAPKAKPVAKAPSGPRPLRPVIRDVEVRPFHGDVNPNPVIEVVWE